MKRYIVMTLLAASTPTLAIAVESHSNIVKVTSEASPISIYISNQLNIPLLEARVKLKPSEEWIELGDIKSGDNNYLVYDELTGAERGILQAKQPNGQWINAMFKKEQDTHIEVVLEKSDDVMTTQSWHHAKTGTMGGRLLIPRVFNEQGEELSYNFQPVSAEQRNNSYSGACSSLSIAIGGIECNIDSSPRVQWNGIGGGLGGGATVGSFILSQSAPSLIGVTGDWGYTAALFYMHVWAPKMDFNGGGFMIGGGGGTGTYRRLVD